MNELIANILHPELTFIPYTSLYLVSSSEIRIPRKHSRNNTSSFIKGMDFYSMLSQCQVEFYILEIHSSEKHFSPVFRKYTN